MNLRQLLILMVLRASCKALISALGLEHYVADLGILRPNQPSSRIRPFCKVEASVSWMIFKLAKKSLYWSGSLNSLKRAYIGPEQ